MRVSYGEGLASHTGPESCGVVREDAVEALTGVRAGWVSSLASISSGTVERRRLTTLGRLHRSSQKRDRRLGSAWSKTQCVHAGTSQKEGMPFRSEAGRS